MSDNTVRVVIVSHTDEPLVYVSTKGNIEILAFMDNRKEPRDMSEILYRELKAFVGGCHLPIEVRLYDEAIDGQDEPPAEGGGAPLFAEDFDAVAFMSDSVGDVTAKLVDFSAEQLQALKEVEVANKNRSTMIEALDDAIADLAGTQEGA